ncbi:MAG: hypothetical protein K6C05_00245 [Anaerovibrio sp.]|uniref:hypothetical protein n=1 Tax=Anaerovibrio sp. TaxID=1872532 RepID=UPI0025E48E74|nr:hypothetical protein [Anaerovibrio sp.]MCR5175258.1 hypothetical protein [Anaerovibrio sp.]
MATMTESQLKAGIIFGDNNTAEYIYMPASELGIESPMCVYEYDSTRDDLDMAAAIRMIQLRSLKPTVHPLLGKTSC